MGRGVGLLLIRSRTLGNEVREKPKWYPAQCSKRWSIKGKEFDTYKIGTTANSTSTMHKLSTEPITKDKFSFDDEDFDNIYLSSQQDNNLKVNNLIDGLISELEILRQNFIETKDKRYWRALIQLLPSAWNQKRTVTLNYQVLRAMYNARKHHKLKEWRNFCSIIESLPYANFLITYTGE